MLITAESGTGKELFAGAIHGRYSRPRAGPFVEVNCWRPSPSAISRASSSATSRGAFTGAVKGRKVSRADGGTIFLDEIGDICPRTQMRFLRVLENMEVYRVGGNRPTESISG